MIAKMLGAAVNLVVYVAAATMIAQLIMLGYLWSRWHMDRGRLVQMLAIAQGLDLISPEADPDFGAPEPAAEQPSIDQVILARVSADRDLRMREMAIKSGAEQLKAEQLRLIGRRDAYERLMADFQRELAVLREGARAKGRTVLGATLEKLDPGQTKVLLLEMIDRQETEEVVLILVDMDERRRAAVVGEFQSPEEITKIAEVLRMIRRGYPEAAIAEEVSQKVDPQNINPL